MYKSSDPSTSEMYSQSYDPDFVDKLIHRLKLFEANPKNMQLVDKSQQCEKLTLENRNLKV